jgi:fibronectin type 3 domain-containing protein
VKKLKKVFFAFLLIFAFALQTETFAAVNLCTPSNGTPFASSVIYNNPASYGPQKAFDGLWNDDKTRWVSNGKIAGEYVGFHFNSPTIVNSIGIMDNYYAAGGVKDFRFQGSNDGTSYTNLYTGTVTTIGAFNYFNFPNTTAYTYYRIVVETNFGYQFYVAVDELQMFGNTLPAPPSPPTGLTATPGYGQVSLSWNSVSGATGYNVYVNGVKSNDSPITSTTAVSGNLTNGTTYSFTVTAVDQYGQESAQSSAVQATPTAPPPLSPPTGLTATPGYKQVSLSWNSVSGATGYNVYVNGVRSNASPIKSTSAISGNLTNGQQYTFTVTAVDQYGQESAQSSAVQATPTAPPPPSPPTGITATGGDQKVTLSWQPVPGVIGYNVYVNGKLSNSSPITSTSVVSANLTNGTQYSFTVTAVDQYGQESAQSPAVTCTPEQPVAQAPPPPSNVKVNNGTISWTTDPNAPPGTVYKIYQNGQLIGTTSGNSYTIPNYNPNAVYTVVASANGADSQQVSTGGLISQNQSWGFSPLDVFSNTMNLIFSIGSYILLLLVVIFAPQIRSFLLSLYSWIRKRWTL